MIEFRRKKALEVDLMPKALGHLRAEGIKFNLITPDKADEVSRVNSKAMVLESFVRNGNGYYQIQVRDKELYRYTQKLLGETFRMRILDVDKDSRVITAECDKEGQAIDIIEILGWKYNLSIVKS